MARFVASRLVIISAIIAILFLHFVSTHRVAATRQSTEIPGQPTITHEPVDCVIANEHPLFRASIRAQGGLHTVKVYFHAQDYSDFYYVEMIQTEGVWQVSLPIAAPETLGFTYYIEAVDLSFNTARTAEYATKVTGEEECERRDEGAPPIVVGSTAAGAPAVPEGFLVTGISRLITSTGASQAVGGGIGALTGVIIGAGAAGATIGLLGGGSDDPPSVPGPPPTVDPPDPPDPPMPPTEPEAGTAPVACFNTNPDPPVIDVNDAVAFNASCSTADQTLHAQRADEIVTYRWRFNDGKPDREGRVVQHLYVTAGTFPAELTVTDSLGNEDRTEVDVIVRGEEPPPPPPPSPPPGGGADLQLSVSSSAGPPVVFTISVTNNGPLGANGVNLTNALSGPFNPALISVTVSGVFTNCTLTPGGVTCDSPSIANGASFTVTITVTPTGPGTISVSSNVSLTPPPPDPNGSNNRGGASVVQLRSPDAIPVEMDTSFTSRLEVPPPDGSVRGQVLVNGTALDETDNTAPFRHPMKGQKGKNTVDARIVSGAGEGRWVFNLSRAPHFVGGSLVVESGQVISQGAGRVVFRVGPSSAPIRFRFRLSP